MNRIILSGLLFVALVLLLQSLQGQAASVKKTPGSKTQPAKPAVGKGGNSAGKKAKKGTTTTPAAKKDGKGKAGLAGKPGATTQLQKQGVGAPAAKTMKSVGPIGLNPALNTMNKKTDVGQGASKKAGAGGKPGVGKKAGAGGKQGVGKKVGGKQGVGKKAGAGGKQGVGKKTGAGGKQGVGKKTGAGGKQGVGKKAGARGKSGAGKKVSTSGKPSAGKKGSAGGKSTASPKGIKGKGTLKKGGTGKPGAAGAQKKGKGKGGKGKKGGMVTGSPTKGVTGNVKSTVGPAKGTGSPEKGVTGKKTKGKGTTEKGMKKKGAGAAGKGTTVKAGKGMKGTGRPAKGVTKGVKTGTTAKGTTGKGSKKMSTAVPAKAGTAKGATKSAKGTKTTASPGGTTVKGVTKTSSGSKMTVSPTMNLTEVMPTAETKDAKVTNVTGKDLIVEPKKQGVASVTCFHQRNNVVGIGGKGVKAKEEIECLFECVKNSECQAVDWHSSAHSCKVYMKKIKTLQTLRPVVHFDREPCARVEEVRKKKQAATAAPVKQGAGKKAQAQGTKAPGKTSAPSKTKKKSSGVTTEAPGKKAGGMKTKAPGKKASGMNTQTPSRNVPGSKAPAPASTAPGLKTQAPPSNVPGVKTSPGTKKGGVKTQPQGKNAHGIKTSSLTRGIKTQASGKKDRGIKTQGTGKKGRGIKTQAEGKKDRGIKTKGTGKKERGIKTKGTGKKNRGIKTQAEGKKAPGIKTQPKGGKSQAASEAKGTGKKGTVPSAQKVSPVGGETAGQRKPSLQLNGKILGVMDHHEIRPPLKELDDVWPRTKSGKKGPVKNCMRRIRSLYTFSIQKIPEVDTANTCRSWCWTNRDCRYVDWDDRHKTCWTHGPVKDIIKNFKKGVKNWQYAWTYVKISCPWDAAPLKPDPVTEELLQEAKSTGKAKTAKDREIEATYKYVSRKGNCDQHTLRAMHRVNITQCFMACDKEELCTSFVFWNNDDEHDDEEDDEDESSDKSSYPRCYLKHYYCPTLNHTGSDNVITYNKALTGIVKATRGEGKASPETCKLLNCPKDSVCVSRPVCDNVRSDPCRIMSSCSKKMNETKHKKNSGCPSRWKRFGDHCTFTPFHMFKFTSKVKQIGVKGNKCPNGTKRTSNNICEVINHKDLMKTYAADPKIFGTVSLKKVETYIHIKKGGKCPKGFSKMDGERHACIVTDADKARKHVMDKIKKKASKKKDKGKKKKDKKGKDGKQRKSKKDKKKRKKGKKGEEKGKSSKKGDTKKGSKTTTAPKGKKGKNSSTTAGPTKASKGTKTTASKGTKTTKSPGGKKGTTAKGGKGKGKGSKGTKGPKKGTTVKAGKSTKAPTKV